MNVKQVIIVRNDLKIRKGKFAVQVAHAAMKDLVKKVTDSHNGLVEFDAEEHAWYNGLFKKVCVQIESEAAMLALYDRAKAAGLRVQLIEDCGLTEFDGPTKTCIAIGPHEDSKFTGFTDTLQLF